MNNNVKLVRELLRSIPYNIAGREGKSVSSILGKSLYGLYSIFYIVADRGLAKAKLHIINLRLATTIG